MNRILREPVGFQLLVVTRSDIEVREISGHVVHGEEHLVRVAKGATKQIGTNGIFREPFRLQSYRGYGR